ncbi:cytochrome d ubiquinol oxidase subunit II [Spongiactinospora sp. TRM90649]|uniref:cytochrome d ubiquinol oxidase subunit II n=1 Tax=Spongiactinospora sp. TRM90649 TaxID=3031114 RepID=UPI0023F6BAF6|nr:cytochrome d ubiquinol oxidase subunit II [Spongiactinospora sp. TRM90649]MDF5757758.1 cytochrome d ubiquinol oxidase subunit II [Spongiactinospora sp. TRM90649]
MELLAVGVLAFYAAGYFVLAGADLGTGMLFGYLGRGRAERRMVRLAIAPFFLTTEVWLVATVGVVAGVFPALEKPLIHGHYEAVVLLLAGWIIRDLGLWFYGGGGRVPLVAITAGSWAVAIAWGLVFSGITGLSPLAGVPVVAALFCVHGLTFAALRLSGGPRERARRLSGASGERVAFAVTAGTMALLCLMTGSRLPLRDSVVEGAGLVPVLAVVTPLLVGAQVWVWWMFRRRVSPDDPDPLGAMPRAAQASSGT